MKIAIASPSYGPRDPEVEKHLRAAIMTASNHGVKWVGDVSAVRQNFVDARNTAALGALELEADGVIWVDDDILIPADAIIKMVSYEKDFVSGLYFQKYPPYHPVVFAWTGKLFSFLHSLPEHDVLAEVDGVGFGCVYTSAKLLKAVLDKYEKPFEWREFSEDLTFCRRANEVGCRPWVDTSIRCGHGHQVHYIGTEDFLKYKEEAHVSNVVPA